MSGNIRILILCVIVLSPLLMNAASVSVFHPVPLTPDFSFLYEQDTLSEITVLQLAVRGGGRAQNGLPGLAWLTLRMGLEPQSTTALYEMMAQGTKISTQVYADYAVVNLRVLSDHLPQALDLLKKSLFDPLFNSVRLKSLRDSMQNQREQMDDSPPSLAYLTHLKAFFPEDPYGFSEYGEEPLTDKIKTSDIKAFYESGFKTANLALAVSSNLSEEKLTAYLRPLFAKVEVGKPVTAPPVRMSTPPTSPVMIPKEQSQALISMAWMLPAKTAEQRLMAFLLKTLLSDGVGARLWGLRSDHNLIYSSTAELVQFHDRVMLIINLRCEEGKRPAALQTLNGILDDLVKNGIQTGEFSATRAYGRTTFYRDSENKDERTLWAVQREMLDLSVDFLSEFGPMTQALNLETFNDYLRTGLVPETRSVVIIGPGRSQERGSDD